MLLSHFHGDESACFVDHAAIPTTDILAALVFSLSTRMNTLKILTMVGSGCICSLRHLARWW